MSCVVSFEVSAKGPRGEDRALTAFPSILALVIFGCAGVVRMANLTALAMSSVEDEWHVRDCSWVGPYWPMENLINLFILYRYSLGWLVGIHPPIPSCKLQIIRCHSCGKPLVSTHYCTLLHAGVIFKPGRGRSRSMFTARSTILQLGHFILGRGNHSLGIDC